MSETLASQVAAGEVVERPASVVKELVENALDAGARAIEVDIQQGGARLIRVQDDGLGMSRDEALLAFERHATSKLHSVDELEAVASLGFRGEALPSIASVARVGLQTVDQDSLSGTEIRIEGGRLVDVREAGLARGTRIEVADLFFNVPARRKFLKAETTEAAHIEQQIRLHALAHPSVRFSFRKDGRVVYDLPGTKDLRVRVAGFLGRELGRELIAIPPGGRYGVKVSGQVLPGHHARRGRRHQCVFLNGRPIEDRAISSALREAYRGSVQEGLHPSVFLVLEMDAREVDVNVHPAKREVRFRHPQRVREAVLTAVEAGLRPAAEEQQHDAPPEPATSPAFTHQARRQEEFPPAASGSDGSRAARRAGDETPTSREAADPPAAAGADSKTGVENDEGTAVAARRKPRLPCPDWSFLAVLHGHFLLFEGEEGLVMMEPVAARDRIWYERLMEGHEQEPVMSQGLLVPELLELDARDLDVALAHADFFADAGIRLESFGGNTLRVESLPAMLKVRDVRGLITGLIDELVENLGSGRGRTLAFKTFASEVAAGLASAEGRGVDDPDALLKALFDCELPYCSSSGKPSLIQLSLNELKRRFG